MLTVFRNEVLSVFFELKQRPSCRRQAEVRFNNHTVTINYASERKFQQIQLWTRFFKIKAFKEQGNLSDKVGHLWQAK